jgi:fatty acid desaturase
MSNLRAELKAELESAGLFDYSPVKVFAKAILLLLATIGLLVAFVMVPSWWVRVPTFFASIATSVALIMFGHDSGHNAVSRRPFVNDVLGYFAFPLLSGLSLGYWRYKHNTLHHSYVNVEGKDPDIRIYPMAMNRTQRSERFGFSRFIQRFQGLAFWPLTLLTVFAMRFDSIKFLVGRGRRVAHGPERLLDIACVVGHYLTVVLVPLLIPGVSFLSVLAFYLAWSAAAGLLLGAIFIPAHMTQPIYSEYSDNFTLQVETTQNLKTNRLFSFLLTGLDHQVEHHLFQRMSHLNLKKASPIVRAFCQRHGLPYNEQGWAAALWRSTLRLDRLPDYEPLPQPTR